MVYTRETLSSLNIIYHFIVAGALEAGSLFCIHPRISFYVLSLAYYIGPGFFFFLIVSPKC